MFDQLIADGVISTRGLKPNAIKYSELVFDVKSPCFCNHGGYEFAKHFSDAYRATVEILDGEQYILSATFSEIDNMGRKPFTGKPELTPNEGKMLKDLAKKGISADTTIADLKHKLPSTRKDARIWKERYEILFFQIAEEVAHSLCCQSAGTVPTDRQRSKPPVL